MIPAILIIVSLILFCMLPELVIWIIKAVGVALFGVALIFIFMIGAGI